MFVLHCTEPVDVFFCPIAEPDFCLFDGADHMGCEVHSKHIAFLHMHRPDMNASTDLYLRMAHISLKCYSVVPRWICGLERCHEAVADVLDFSAIELGDHLATLGKVSTSYFVYGFPNFISSIIALNGLLATHLCLSRNAADFFSGSFEDSSFETGSSEIGSFETGSFEIYSSQICHREARIRGPSIFEV